LERTGTSVENTYVDGTRLSITFVPEFGQQLIADETSLLQSVADFMSLMRSETGSTEVSVEIASGDDLIATGETTDSGENRIKLLQ